MFADYIKPIPKSILKKIQKLDDNRPTPQNTKRWYAYLTIIENELCKITVAVKKVKGVMRYEQVAAHYVPSEVCVAKNIHFTMIAGYIPQWDTNEDWWTAEDKYFHLCAPIVNMELIDKLEKYKYSAWRLYPHKANIIQYLRMYEKYPETEYLLKLGLSKYVLNQTILREVRKDHKFLKWLAKNNQDIGINKDVPVIIKAYKTGTNIELLQEIANYGKYLRQEKCYKVIKKLWDGRILKFREYIKEQETNIRIYLDYINACEGLGLDMSLNKNLKPHNLRFWHDERIAQYQNKLQKEDEIKRATFYEKFLNIAKKYFALNYTNQNVDYVITIAKSPSELVNEGDKLKHCVGTLGYDKKMVDEKSLIFFVRKKCQPDTPFVTMEFSLKDKTIKQCYAFRNQQPSDDVKQFVNLQWLSHAKKQLKQISA